MTQSRVTAQNTSLGLIMANTSDRVWKLQKVHSDRRGGSDRHSHEEGVVSLSGRKVKGVMGSFFQMRMSMFAHACV